MTYKEIKGDLITLAKDGKFDVIAHGCNCFCRMKRGLAPQMAEAFGCDKFPLEDPVHTGDISKLGQIDYQYADGIDGPLECGLIVVNTYTQYRWSDKDGPFDYEAFTMCTRKMNHTFRGRHIGLPKIGAGLAGGDWELIKAIIIREFRDCNVTVVVYKH